MSRLQELLEELCPDGVEYKRLGDISDICRGASPRPIKNFITDSEDGVNWIKIGDVKTGSKYITSCAEKITQEGAKKSRKVYKGDFILSNSMSFGRPYILDIDGCIHDGWLSISNFNNYMVTDFLYYLLMSGKVQKEMAQKASFGGAVQNLNADIVRGISLPVPPLEVQREIVRVLDSFTLLLDELTDELTARKKQYEYYSDVLFKSDISIDEWKTIGEVVLSLKTGLNPRQNFKLNTGGDKPYITGKDIFNNTINVSEKTDLIFDKDIELINRRACLESGDVLFASTGTGTVGRMAVIELYNNDWAVSETMFCLKPNNDVILPYYLMYALYTKTARGQFEPKISKGSVPHLKVKDLLDVRIPVPSLKEQKRVVDLMRRFDTICNDISSGLPAEIEARRKQYEYYRDKLLSFKELV